jgi:hypothetical protein
MVVGSELDVIVMYRRTIMAASLRSRRSSSSRR